MRQFALNAPLKVQIVIGGRAAADLHNELYIRTSFLPMLLPIRFSEVEKWSS